MAAVALCSLFANAQTPNLHWAYRNNGPSFYEDRGLKTTIDNQGNVISTGYEAFDCTDIDIVTIKYNEAGDTLWTVSYTHLDVYKRQVWKQFIWVTLVMMQLVWKILSVSTISHSTIPLKQK